MGRYDRLLTGSPTKQAKQPQRDSEKGSQSNDGMTPTKTSRRGDVMTPRTAASQQSRKPASSEESQERVWRDIVQDTETHNTAFRLTSRERDQIEDLVLDLRRKHKIKTGFP